MAHLLMEYLANLLQAKVWLVKAVSMGYGDYLLHQDLLVTLMVMLTLLAILLGGLIKNLKKTSNLLIGY